MKKVLTVLITTFLSVSAFAQAHKVSPENSPSWKSMADVYKVEVIPSKKMYVKVLSYIGDSALNGTNVVLAVLEKESSDWNVFYLVNTGDYKILPSTKDGYLKIELKTDKLKENGYETEHVRSVLYVNLLTADRVNGQIEIEEIK